MKQRKKITSIANIDCKEGRLRFGTIDKKNPSVMFIEGGFYIMPLIKKPDYKSDMNEITKQLKTIVKQHIEHSQYFKPEHMFFTDIAEDRIMPDKKTYFSFQLFVKPNLSKNMNFKTIMDKMKDKEQWVTIIKDGIEKNNYKITKTKKSF